MYSRPFYSSLHVCHREFAHGVACVHSESFISCCLRNTAELRSNEWRSLFCVNVVTLLRAFMKPSSNQCSPLLQMILVAAAKYSYEQSICTDAQRMCYNDVVLVREAEVSHTVTLLTALCLSTWWPWGSSMYRLVRPRILYSQICDLCCIGWAKRWYPYVCLYCCFSV